MIPFLKAESALRVFFGERVQEESLNYINNFCKKIFEEMENLLIYLLFFFLWGGSLSLPLIVENYFLKFFVEGTELS